MKYLLCFLAVFPFCASACEGSLVVLRRVQDGCVSVRVIAVPEVGGPMDLPKPKQEFPVAHRRIVLKLAAPAKTEPETNFQVGRRHIEIDWRWQF